MDLLSRAFCFTSLPGCLTVPAADRDMLLTFKSSTKTIAWFLLMVVEGLVEVIPAGIGNANVDTLDLGFRLFPVARELLLSAHGLLRFAQLVPVLTETAERLADRSIGQGAEADNANVDAYGLAVSNWLLYLTLCLD